MFELGEWGHGFCVGGCFGVIWGVMVTVIVFLSSAATRVEESPDEEQEPADGHFTTGA